MIKEEWRPIKGYEGLYAVSSLGRIKSLVTRTCTFPGKIIKPQQGRVGYLRAKLFNESGQFTRPMISRLVAIAFIPNPENKPQINHKDGNKTKNFTTNLGWCTQSENIRHRIDVLGVKFGCNHNNTAKLTYDQAETIRRLCSSTGLTQVAIAKVFGVSQRLISRIVTNKGYLRP